MDGVAEPVSPIGAADDAKAVHLTGRLLVQRVVENVVHHVALPVVGLDTRPRVAVGVLGLTVDLAPGQFPHALQQRLGRAPFPAVQESVEDRLQRLVVAVEVAPAPLGGAVMHAHRLPRSGSRSTALHPRENHREPFLPAQQLLDGRVELISPGTQLRDLGPTVFERAFELLAFARIGAVEVHHLADLTQAEPEAPTAEDQTETNPVALQVDALLPPPLRLQQAALLVIADRARRHVELSRQIRNAIPVPAPTCPRARPAVRTHPLVALSHHEPPTPRTTDRRGIGNPERILRLRKRQG